MGLLLEGDGVSGPTVEMGAIVNESLFDVTVHKRNQVQRKVIHSLSSCERGPKQGHSLQNLATNEALSTRMSGCEKGPNDYH